VAVGASVVVANSVVEPPVVAVSSPSSPRVATTAITATRTTKAAMAAPTIQRRRRPVSWPDGTSCSAGLAVVVDGSFKASGSCPGDALLGVVVSLISSR
jgi:hypothetical protein